MSNNKKKTAKPKLKTPDLAEMAAKVAFRNKTLGVPYAEKNKSTAKWAQGHTHVHGSPAFIWGNHEIKPRPQLTVQMDLVDAVSTARLLTELKWFLKGYRERDIDKGSNLSCSHIEAVDQVIRDIEFARAEHALQAKEAADKAK